MAAGDFTIPDTTTNTSSDLNTLFGVAQGVGETPVPLTAGTPGTSRITAVGTLHETLGEPGKKTTVAGALQGFYGMDPKTLENLQRQLFLGGFFSDAYYKKNGKTPLFGTADEDSFAAFKTAVVRSARAGKPLPDVLTEAAATNTATLAASKTTPTILQPPSPVDIRAQIVASAKEKYGHKADEGLINDIITEVQRMTVAEQQGTADAQAAGGGTVPQSPNVGNYVESRLQQAAPNAVAAHDAVGVYGDFLKILGRGGVGA